MSAETGDGADGNDEEAGERLRAAFADEAGAPAAAEAGAGEASAGCPPAEEIFAAARGALAPAAALALVEHSASCASCAQAFRLAIAVVREVEPASAAGAGGELGSADDARDELDDAAAGAERLRAEPAGSRGPRPAFLSPRTRGMASAAPRRRWALGVAASLAAASGLFALVVRERAPVYRSEAVELAALPGEESLARGRFVLRWTPLPAGTRYSVNVATPALAVLFARGGLTAPEVQVPEGALAPVAAGAQVVWRVSALLPDGRRAESAAFLTAVR